MGEFEKGKLKYLFETDCICGNAEKIYFSAKNYDALVSIDLKNYECRIEKCFSGKYTTTYCAHAKTIVHKQYIFCIPRYSRYIIKYDLNTGNVDEIMVPNVTDVRSVFTEAVAIEDQIICFPEFYDSIISINMETNEISAIRNVKSDSQKTYIFVSNAANRKDKIIIPFYDRNQLLLLDKNNNDIFTVDMKMQADGYVSISCTEDKLFLLGNNHICYALKENGEVLIEWKDINGVLYTIDNELWIVDKMKKRICRVNSPNLLLVEYKIKSIGITDNDSQWIESALINEYVCIFVRRNSSEIGIFMCNGKEERFELLSINRFCKEFYEKKSVFAEREGNELSVIEMLMNVKGNFNNEKKNVGVDIYDRLKGD